MYSLDQIKTGIKWSIESPSLFFRELNRLYHKRRYGPGYNRTGIDVMDEDWDTLVILDACRYELFEQENTLSGQLSKRISRGSHTSEFLRGNFDGKTLHETVYTTASPQLEKRRDEIDVEFHAVENVWNGDRWDSEQRTVPPKAMTEAGIESHETYPRKRHIVHYIQPHYPFIGYDFDEEASTVGQAGHDIWEQLIRGRANVAPETIWRAYRNNLKLVLNAVHQLLKHISGKTVVTSDHGNMIGERSAPLPINEWGHPPGIYNEELVSVPWLIVEGEPRREVQTDPPCDDFKTVEDDLIENRLDALGYS